MQQQTLTAALLASLPARQRQAILDHLTDEDKARLRYRWSFWARPEQLPPPGDWQFWSYVAGRGAGKTRAGAEFVRKKVADGCRRIALVAPTNDDFHKVMVMGESGILACSPPWDRPEYNENKKSLTWPNGAMAFGYSAEKPSRLRGPNHDAMWCDEIAAWHGSKERRPGEVSRRQETWDMAMFGLRLGANPQCFVSTTPLPVDVIRDLIAGGLENRPGYVLTRGSTYDNRANLAPQFFNSIITKYEGTRLGRQELHGELLLDVPGALWSHEMVAAANARHRSRIAPPDMRRIVVAVDPSGASSATDISADEIGIIVAGEGTDGDYYVIADASMRGSPRAWAGAAVNAYFRYKADKIVAEKNFGGEMVRATIEGVTRNVKVELVTATRGKVVRAEPVALLYEKNRVHHLEAFPHLEDQMVKMTPAGYIGDNSPDRLDALVWALSDLSQGTVFQVLGVL